MAASALRKIVMSDASSARRGLYPVVPILTNLILYDIAHRVLGLPKTCRDARG